MKKERYGLVVTFVVFIGVLSMQISCTSKPGLVGKWQEIGRTATVEFFHDGTFKAVDNQGLAVAGNYFYESGNLRFDIAREGMETERVLGRCSVEKGLLTLTSENGKEVEQYKRQN